jgi:hypothetical protein
MPVRHSLAAKYRLTVLGLPVEARSVATINSPGTGWVIGFRDMFDGTSNHRSRTIVTGPLGGSVVNFNNQWFDTFG